VETELIFGVLPNITSGYEDCSGLFERPMKISQLVFSKQNL